MFEKFKIGLRDQKFVRREISSFFESFDSNNKSKYEIEDNNVNIYSRSSGTLQNKVDFTA